MKYNVILLTNLSNDNGQGNRRYIFHAEAQTPDEAAKQVDTSGEWFVVPGLTPHTRLRTGCIQAVEIVVASNQER